MYSSDENEHPITRVPSELGRQGNDLINNVIDDSTKILVASRNRRVAFLEQFVDDPKRREAIMGELEIIKTEFEFRKQALILIRKTQVQAIQEACNQYLLQGKAALRVEMGKLILSKASELKDEVDNAFDKFVRKVDQRLQEAESIKNARLRESRIQQLEKDYEEFAGLQKQILQKFLQILHEEIEIE